MDITSIAIAVLQALPGLITAGQNVLDLIESTNTVITNAQAAGADPSPADWATLQGKIAALSASLQASPE